MKNLFEASRVKEINDRLEKLNPESKRLWGKMSAAQALAHCSMAIEMALGDIHPPRMVLGRIVGWFVKPIALKDDKPMQRNSPTVKGLVIKDDRSLDKERERLRALIHRFAAPPTDKINNQPHSFFGRLTAGEWAILMYKHLDHHLRQFGV